jgi:hypothetical protein
MHPVWQRALESVVDEYGEQSSSVVPPPLSVLLFPVSPPASPGVLPVEHPSCCNAAAHSASECCNNEGHWLPPPF